MLTPPQIPRLPSDLLPEAEDRWHAFKQSAAKQAAVVETDQEFLDEVLRVWTFSDFVYKSCLKDPDILVDFTIGRYQNQSNNPGDYHQSFHELLQPLNHLVDISADSSLAPYIQQLQSILRNHRRKEMVRIAWRDLTGRASLLETMTELSHFADACIDVTLNYLYEQHCTIDGVPRGKNGSIQKLVVFGLGKLGGQELNFSSDVDLIFGYPEAGQTDHLNRPRSNEEFFVRLARNLIKTLAEITPDGQVFRVDMRLRPDGENGPLVMSFENMEDYYQLHGREWERYAWIKSRAVAGDIPAANTLIDRLKPFIYRRYLDYGVFDSLRHMKQKISLELKRKGLENNIKLGPGGIREIEFFGQVFQLLRGGVSPNLQDQHILMILDELVKDHYITLQTCDELKAAYYFLRYTEHRLQEFSDRQTHDLPQDHKTKLILALSMGFNDWQSFLTGLKKHTDTVHGHFSGLLSSKHMDSRQNSETAGIPELECLWSDTDTDEQSCQNLSNVGFQDPENVINLLDQFKHSVETRLLSREGKTKIDRLMPIIIETTSHSPQPDLALKRIIDLITTIQRRTNYVSLLLENPNALDHLIRFANASPWIITFLSKHPVLLDELIDPRTLYSPPERIALKKDLKGRLSKFDNNDLEYQIEALCIFRQVNELRVAAADITDVLPLMRVSDYLSDIAETILQEVVNLSWQHLVAKHGEPSSSLDSHRCEKGFAIIAYGKLGGLELGYGSDLDIVFIHAGDKGQTNGSRPIDNAQFYTRLGQRVVHLLTTHTAAGKIYEVDMRLRPSGASGLLVSHYSSFHDYQSQDAWTWEHQALLRTRAIIGDKHLTSWFNHLRHDILTRKRDYRTLRNDVVDMREKMRKSLSKKGSQYFDLKQDPGGIVDIEFLVQYLVLLKAHQYSDLVTFSDNVRQLQALSETGILNEKIAHLLRRIYLVYRATVHRLDLAEKPHTIPLDRFRDLRHHVELIWSYYMKGQ